MQPFRRTLVLGVLLAVVGEANGQAPSAAPRVAADPQAAIADFLGVIDRPRVAIAPSAPVASQANGYSQELLSFAAEANERVPAIVLKKGTPAGRLPVIVALHGTGGSKESMRSMMQSYADLGFLTVSIDARHHGERAKPIPGLDNPYMSAMLQAYRTGDGHPYLYDTVWDVIRLLDYLATRPDVDMQRIGLIGNSKGGTEAYLAAAVDPRIAVVVPLIGVQSYGWSLRHASGWEARTWTIREAVEASAADAGQGVSAGFMRRFYERITPGLVDKFDGPAMLPLIAPRPMLVINGDSDPRSPLGGVREAVGAAERAYAAAGAAERFVFYLEEDAAHEVTAAANQAARDWFVRWLRPTPN